ncbi:MAG: carbamoyltransferase HypF [Acidobacteriota bacterium]|nr:carbamoyltransferase HypF [Acidobacteriota bacterium]
MTSTTISRRMLRVSGLVQGVGFRPFVFRLANDLALTGFIWNDASGVTIEVQGPTSSIDAFANRLRNEAPPLSQILSIESEDRACIEESTFRIVESRKDESVHTLISPDVTVCADCLNEMFNPEDRRYRYPFINCTNCGPRFTIVGRIPYDRPFTSMAKFPMCPACQAEYDDPRNRRFHAQPNACWQCGPQLELWNNENNRTETDDAIAAVIQLLRAGHIVAVKGLGGFHLACDALNASSIALLRQRKHRVEKPFAIMVPDVDTARCFCEVNDLERETLESIQRPVVLLRRNHDCSIPEAVAPGNRDLGVFLPYTPIHALIFREGGFKALVMTSANASEEPIAIDNEEARKRLSSLADFYLVHNRDILLRCDDSVVRVVAGRRQQLRRSRGFVPVPIQLHRKLPAVLAVGGELKNTICLAEGEQAFLSQHIGDIENLAGYGFLLEAIQHLQQILEIKPQIIAYDLHPDYLSARWAQQQSGYTLVGVQHHHAHIASCMAENHLDGPVIGFALDGTGYGADGAIWGGEVLIADYQSFTRAAHFEYLPMPGSAAAIREPWRMAVSHLQHTFGTDFSSLPLPFLKQIDPGHIALATRMVERRINTPLTSSCGRLFDAVASVVGLRQKVNYEGQAAIELENAAADCTDPEPYPFELQSLEDKIILCASPMFRALTHDLLAGTPVSILSARFHNGLANALVRTAHLLRERTGLHHVCLSGGTFHNRRLLMLLCQNLHADGFQIFTQNQVPAGDGGLSLGQALVAAHQHAHS